MEKKTPSGYPALGDTSLETIFFLTSQQTAFLLHHQKEHEKDETRSYDMSDETL